MYDGVADLISYDGGTLNEYGQRIPTETRKTVFVQPRGVYASEFYAAAQIGLKPSITLDMSNPWDYDGQSVLEYSGKEYDVIRVDWSAQRDRISLVCEERIRNDAGSWEGDESE